MDDSYFDAPPMPDLYDSYAESYAVLERGRRIHAWLEQEDEDVDPPDEYNREEMIREEELSNDDLS